jgi:hypothetical protein
MRRLTAAARLKPQPTMSPPINGKSKMAGEYSTFHNPKYWELCAAKARIIAEC